MEYWQYINIAEEIIRPLHKKTILEIGCGDGRISEHIAQQFPDSKVLGIDISRRAISFAALLGKHAEFRHVDLFEINNQYDVILLIEVLEHISKEEIDAFLSKIRTILEDKGAVVLSVPTPLLPMLHPGHVQHFHKNLLAETLGRAGLEIKNIVYHLDVRFSRYSFVGRAVIGLLENRVWSLKPAIRVLKRFHTRYLSRTTSRYAGRIIATVVCRNSGQLTS